MCTGNVCRSPMAAALLARRLGERGVGARVASVGLVADGYPAPREAVAVMAARGLDTSGHRSRRMVRADLEAADLVVGMARVHVREAVTAWPPCWPRAFTLRELVRRGEMAGPRHGGQRVADWLASVHAGRSRSALLGDSREDDVDDPIGGSRQAYEAVAAELDDLTGRLVGLAFGPAEPAALASSANPASAETKGEGAGR